MALGPRQIVVLIALAAAVLSVFLPWASAGPIDVKPFTEGARFRLGDWLDQDTVDGLAVAAVAGVALLLMLVQIKGGSQARMAGQVAKTLTGLLVPLALMEMQFILSKDGISLAIGMYLLIGGAALAAISSFIPQRL